MPIKITYFVHGTTTDNEQDLATGWQGGELSELGRRQSEDLGRLVADGKFDAVFCSDLKRAVDSTQLAFGGKYNIMQDKRLREADYGDFTSQPVTFKDKMAEYIDKPFPNGECLKDVEKRLAEFLNFLKENYDGKHIAVIAHQAPQLALEVLLKNKSWPQAIADDWRHTGSWQAGWKYLLL